MIGRIIGNYQITSELARGGMGMVYRGQHLYLPREVIVKSILLASYSPSVQVHLKARFRREAFIQAQLNHANIARVYEFFSDEDDYFLVMEYVQGMSLRDLLAREGRPTPVQAVYLFKQALSALDYAHNFSYVDESDINCTGVIHRDIKPANLLLDAKGRLKITDFGIVKILGEQGTSVTTTQTGFHPGTPEYMSPEQMRGGEIDKRSDIYSLGVTFYEVLTGRLPFERPAGVLNMDALRSQVDLEPLPILKLRQDLPPSLGAMVMRALRKNPADRYQTAAELLEALKSYEAQQAANGAARASNARAALQPQFPQLSLIAAADLELETTSHAQPSQASIEKATTVALDIVNHTPDFSTTQVINLAQSISPEPHLAQLGQQVFASIQQAGQAGSFGGLRLAAIGLVTMTLTVGTGVYLFSQQASNSDTSAIASGIENTAPAVSATSPATQKSVIKSKSASQPEMHAFKQARGLEEQEKYGEAIKIYEEYLAHNPNASDTNSVESRLLQLRQLQASLVSADAAMAAGKFKLAAQEYGAAIRLMPDSQRAKEGFSQALAKIPDFPLRPAMTRSRPRIPGPGPAPEISAPSPEKPAEAVEAPPANGQRLPEGFRKLFKPTPTPTPPDSASKP